MLVSLLTFKKIFLKANLATPYPVKLISITNGLQFSMLIRISNFWFGNLLCYTSSRLLKNTFPPSLKCIFSLFIKENVIFYVCILKLVVTAFSTNTKY